MSKDFWLHCWHGPAFHVKRRCSLWLLRFLVAINLVVVVEIFIWNWRTVCWNSFLFSALFRTLCFTWTLCEQLYTRMIHAFTIILLYFGYIKSWTNFCMIFIVRILLWWTHSFRSPLKIDRVHLCISNDVIIRWWRQMFLVDVPAYTYHVTLVECSRIYLMVSESSTSHFSSTSSSFDAASMSTSHDYNYDVMLTTALGWRS